uniref:Exonuclease domain-containing protein n=1 Tax=Ditylum brightwellii TaxID=49249 RepID=A0A7S4RGL0_9STRA
MGPSAPFNPSTGVPIALYTDENPATTIKGTGFKNRDIAERTIFLTSQPGARYKQHWTIRAMRERAAYHPHQTDGIREAIAVFDAWLKSYQPPTCEERREQGREWRHHRDLCSSMANHHSYGKNPSRGELRRAKEDLKDGQQLFSKLLLLCQRQRLRPMGFPLVSFTALFGGPGIHGYGSHNIDANNSLIVVNGEGLKELLGDNVNSLQLALMESIKITKIHFDRKDEVARAEIEKYPGHVTLQDLWKGGRKDKDQNTSHESKKTNNAERVEEKCSKISQKIEQVSSPSWTCTVCTFIHVGESKVEFLACELCGTARTSATIAKSQKYISTTVTAATRMKRKQAMTVTSKACPTSLPSSSWGCLRAPTKKDIQGPCKRRKGFDQPPSLMDFLVVLDFEWTADDKRKMEPVSEITQFPSVLMQLTNGSSAAADRIICNSLPVDDRIPPDLKCQSKSSKIDAICFSVFDSYVRPTLNPKLTMFSIELTGITQNTVDSAPTIDAVLIQYVHWLRSHGLVDEKGNRIGNWAFVTWGDCDIMTTLRLELLYKSIDLPPCFNRWINLKDDAIFRRHYRREPRGGLRACVESVGATWEGRAHNGLVDSINTAKIVRNMVQAGFRFVRYTRGLNRNGTPFGTT